MAEAAMVINVSEIPQPHGNGLSGQWVVPGKTRDEDFAMVVFYPTPEIQDIGDDRKTIHWLKAMPLAKDVVGLRSEEDKRKFGLLLCAAEPDLPKTLLKAIESEMEFLNENPPDVKYIRKKNMMLATNIESQDVKDRKIELSALVEQERKEFERSCRRLVRKDEFAEAKRNMMRYYGQLVVDADAMWAGREQGEHRSINILHRHACRTLGQERPWCYIPQELVDCPGCGQKIKEDIIVCGHCGGLLDEPFDVYAKMTKKERSMRLYPARYAPDEAPERSRGGHKET